MRRSQLTLSVLVVCLLAGCGVAAPVTPSTPVRDEAAYLREMRAQPNLNAAATDGVLIAAGDGLCSLMDGPDAIREALVAGVAASPQGPVLAPVYVSAAQRFLCPNKQFKSGTAPVLAPALAGRPSLPYRSRQPLRSVPETGNWSRKIQPVTLAGASSSTEM
jgi:hypothetical protein